MNNYPPEWGASKFETLFTISIGGTPSRSEPEYWDSNFDTLNHWVSIRDLQEKIIFRTKERLTDLGVKKSNVKLIPKNSLLMSFKLSVGKLAIAGCDLYTNEAIAAFLPKNNLIDMSYCYQGLQYWDLLKDIDQAVKGVTLNKEKLANLVAILPPLPEQKKIAAILSSVDDVIEKTQAQINKLKDLKTGMMQELLSPREGTGQPQGVGENGKGHTEFKDSPLGRIPVGWDVGLLDHMARRGSGHTPDKKKPEYWNGEIKWISLTDSYRLDQLYISDSEKKVSQLGIENSSAVLHPKGTVVMSRDAGIGKSAIITDIMAVSQHFMAWICGDLLDNYFLYYLLQYWKPRFEAIAMGSTIKTIGLPYFKKLKVPVPSIEEQKKIASSIKSVDMKIFSLIEKNNKNKANKKALMQDLLTGKVRVAVPSQPCDHGMSESIHVKD